MFILGDDIGTGDVPGYWNSGKVDMPHLQNLVDTGTVFTDVHSTPLCSPSRYVALSGNYQHRGYMYGGTWKVNYQSGQFRDGQQSIAEVLRSNSYHTAMMGKWHMGGKLMNACHELGYSLFFLLFHSLRRLFIYSIKQAKFRQKHGSILETNFI